MKHALLVGAGGFAGSILRWVTIRWVQARYPMFGLPVGTMVVNLSGCLLIGLLAGAISMNGDTAAGTNVRLLFGIGLLGGYTTYSTFALESLALVADGDYGRTLAFVLGHLVLGVLAAALGMAIARSTLGLLGSV